VAPYQGRADIDAPTAIPLYHPLADERAASLCDISDPHRFAWLSRASDIGATFQERLEDLHR
jgi:hypothetical protein